MEESEKSFKCPQCNSKFATAEQLQNHSRRHEMTINLSERVASSSLSTPLLGKGSLSAGVIGFVDETPTPTRFIRNCEEVGLFQDLQNVNPFDEDFKKAANGTATPSGEATGFEFTFGGGTPTLEAVVVSSRNVRSKRRYSEQDTLNTPQVFPYFSSTGGCHTLTTHTASMSSCLTPTPQTLLTTENLSNTSNDLPLPQTLQNDTTAVATTTTSYNHEEHVSIIAYTSAISQQTSNQNKSDSGATPVKLIEIETPKSKKSLLATTPTTPDTNSVQKGKLSSLKTRSKANLKLDLKTVILKNKTSTLSEKVIGNSQAPIPVQEKASSASAVPEFVSKKELLERNRAAAHRSRERRKQWIYGLESRCRALEALLAQSQSEVTRLKTENDALKAQLQNQNKEPVNTAPPETITIQPASCSQIVIHHNVQTPQEQIVHEPLVDNIDSSSELIIVSPIVLPKVKSKRGRPRKGEERRVPILTVPILSDEHKLLPKIPILPLSQAKKAKN